MSIVAKRSTLRQLAEYVAGRAVILALAMLPRRAGQAVGRGLGRLFYAGAPRYRCVALGNLARAFGGAEERERRRIARASFAHLGMICVDAAYFGRLLRWPSERLAVYEGEEHLLSAAALGRGVLLFSGHFGHWELVALLQHRLGVPMAMVTRPLENERFDRLLTRMRGLSGNRVLPKRNASRGVLRALREGRSVALLIDQNVRSDGGIFVDFFGVPASTTPALAIFALRSGAPIVPVFSYPLRDGRLRIAYREAIHPVRRGAFTDDIREITRACTAILEDEVRRYPELWLWMHNRWKTRPRGAARVRPSTPLAEAPAENLRAGATAAGRAELR